jgi:hypothetical protein
LLNSIIVACGVRSPQPSTQSGPAAYGPIQTFDSSLPRVSSGHEPGIHDFSFQLFWQFKLMRTSMKDQQSCPASSRPRIRQAAGAHCAAG